VSDEPTPQPEEQDAPPERRKDEDATRGAGHEDPEAARERVGLGDQRPEPSGAPPPGETA
jgi:hypothetical protein